MNDPQQLHDDALHIVLHAWIAAYVRKDRRVRSVRGGDPVQLSSQALRLRDSALQLQAALEKMRLANERLASRMAEHKAFFAKFQAPE